MNRKSKAHARPMAGQRRWGGTVPSSAGFGRARSPLAGRPVPPEMLVDVPRLQREYSACKPDFSDPGALVHLRRIGHCGSPFNGTFTESHVLALAQAICDHRRRHRIDGPLYIGRDTRALSEPVQRTLVEVLAANRVHAVIQRRGGVTPAPVISRAILDCHRTRLGLLADGIVIGAACNPPDEGGLRYIPPPGSTAEAEVRMAIEARANELLRNGNKQVQWLPFARALQAPTTREEDLLLPYVHDLRNVIDMEVIRHTGLTIAADALGGTAGSCWDPIREIYRLNISVMNQAADPTFAFIKLDYDGRIRLDSGSTFVIADLIAMKGRHHLSFANDLSADRFAIVTPSMGLMSPNEILPVAANYLLKHRPGWPAAAGIGRTMIGSHLMDRVASRLGRPLCELPPGFHWMAAGLFDAQIGFGGDETPGSSFLRQNGTVWTTAPDGIVTNLLAAEMTAVTGRDPQEHYRELVREFGTPVYTRVDVPATLEDKQKLMALASSAVTCSMLAGEPITEKLTYAPCNGAAFGGLKVVTANGWFAARPSGSEDLYRIHAESFGGQQHLDAIVSEAREIVGRALAAPA